VALVYVFNEGLDTGPLDEFLLVKTTLGLSGVAGNTSHQQMRESMFLNS